MGCHRASAFAAAVEDCTEEGIPHRHQSEEYSDRERERERERDKDSKGAK